MPTCTNFFTCPIVLKLCFLHTQMDFEGPEPDMCACPHDHADDCVFDNPAPQPTSHASDVLAQGSDRLLGAILQSHPSSMHTAPPLHELESRLPRNEGAKKVFVTIDNECSYTSR